MHDKKSPMANSHYLKNLKQQFRNKNLIETTIHLVKCNDHDSLAFLARTYGVPPQLRHVVWPILLKYHPMCISPNITSNTISWDPITNDFILNDPFLKSKAPTDKQDKSDDENILPYDIESIILHDLKNTSTPGLILLAHRVMLTLPISPPRHLFRRPTLPLFLLWRYCLPH